MTSYGFLLTYSRDVTVVFISDLATLDETFNFLVANGFGAVKCYE